MRRFFPVALLVLNTLSANAADQAGWPAVIPGGTGENFESRLRIRHENNPDDIAAAFQLGTFLANRARWVEAETIFSSANCLARACPPELEFNHAIALEHLGRHRDAIAHYRAAARQAGTAAASQARQRLTHLEEDRNEQTAR